jgi:hypothetical protein
MSHNPRTACDDAELLRSLCDVRVVAISTLIVDFVLGLFWHMDEATIVGFLEVQIRHPVIALIGDWRYCTASSGLRLRKVHCGSESIPSHHGMHI